jgi:translation initiation factor 2B subunit (eIF-2B alpha/beta/delta family)
MSELVNHPLHYKSNGFEAIDIIEAYELSFSLGNSIKYILRSDKKGNKKQDLEKAIWYLNRELENLK